MSRYRRGVPDHPSSLSLLVARAVAGHHAGDHRSDLQAAVTELARIARLSVIRNGVLASDDVRMAADAVASKHLNRRTADRELTRALRRITDRQLRNAIEVAHDQVLEPSEVAHYYAGLMAGLALLEMGRSNY